MTGEGKIVTAEALRGTDRVENTDVDKWCNITATSGEVAAVPGTRHRWVHVT
jgi:hypothetical protein